MLINVQFYTEEIQSQKNLYRIAQMIIDDMGIGMVLDLIEYILETKHIYTECPGDFCEAAKGTGTYGHDCYHLNHCKRSVKIESINQKYLKELKEARRGVIDE